MRIQNEFEQFLCLCPNLIDDNIISASRPGLKTGMDFTGLVWKQVWIIKLFGIKSDQDLKKRAAHPYQEFPGVPPSPPRDSRQLSINSISSLSGATVFLS